MKPKNLPLFYASLVLGLVGVWVFVFGLYETTVAPMDPSYCCGANIGVGAVFYVAKLLGASSLATFVLSFVIKPGSSKNKR